MTKKEIIKSLSNRRVNSIIRNVCGEMIGYGQYRDVYEVRGNKRYVIKIERDMSDVNFANATEWRNYINNKDWTPFGKFLAPCHAIDETGQILLQTRVVQKDLPFAQYPKKIPNLFTDIKVHNFGWIGEKFVCCDYSFLRNLDFKMITPKWWSLND